MSKLRSARKQSLCYTDVRNQIESGDLLLFQGTNWVSRAIRVITKTYSHVGIAMWAQPAGEPRPRLLVFETGKDGVVASNASTAIDKYIGRVDLFVLSAEARKHLKIQKVFEACEESVGAEFSYMGLARYILRRILAKLGLRSMKGGKNDSDPPAMFCSWYVSKVFDDSGFDLVPSHEDSLTNPTDLARSEHTIMRGTVKWDSERAEERFDTSPAEVQCYVGRDPRAVAAR